MRRSLAFRGSPVREEGAILQECPIFQPVHPFSGSRGFKASSGRRTCSVDHYTDLAGTMTPTRASVWKDRENITNYILPAPGPNFKQVFPLKRSRLDDRQPRTRLPLLFVVEPLMLAQQVRVHVCPNPSMNDLHVLNPVKAAISAIAVISQPHGSCSSLSPLIPSFCFGSFSLQSLYNWYY